MILAMAVSVLLVSMTIIEGLNGLLPIGWSASFTYLGMERLWPVHAERRIARASRHGKH